MNTILDFEIAKLLKEKGFNEKTDLAYVYRDFAHQQPTYEGRLTKSVLQCDIPAPSIAEVVMWLYEKYNIWIIVTPIPYCEGLTHWRWEHKSTDYNTRGFHWKKQSDYLSPIEAYSEAIKYTLINLI